MGGQGMENVKREFKEKSEGRMSKCKMKAGREIKEQERLRK